MNDDEYTIVEPSPVNEEGESEYTIADEPRRPSEHSLAIGIDSHGIFLEMSRTDPLTDDSEVSVRAVCHIQPDNARRIADSLYQIADLYESDDDTEGGE